MNRNEYILTGDEEYVDVYGDHEYLAAHEMAEYDGALVETEDGYKASVWLSESETEILLQLAEAQGIPPRHLIQEWIIERIEAAAKSVTEPLERAF